MHFLSPALEQYITDLAEDEPVLLQELRRETHIKVVQPRMLTGHYQGRLLSILSKLFRPKRILEIGTYTGYSALCLAEGLAPQGELHTIEINEELQPIQNKYFERSYYRSSIVQHVGSALEVLPALEPSFDLVFIDAKKVEYPDYYTAVLPLLKQGSIILSDNILWSGKVAEEVPEVDKATKALQRYNKMLKDDPRVESIILPVRDGLSLSRVVG
ncbi:O-methyltransferase [Aureicoccus marinus]|uniref:Methyltransferase n=1 Tax=Aureicoccus marinus TaxID=754435 RepID=A0A2S7T7R6_9FLAO|nr:O-methyltransferase [Aureicoccus marinus]PQJ15621.1 methyltransferase [Aureicoccus marinus]